MIKFLDIRKINQPYIKGFENTLTQVLDSGWVLMGNELSSFEKEYAEYCNVRHCIGVGNGLDAITLLLKGFILNGQLKEGDEVIVPANTYIATVLGIQNAGLKPVLVEPNEDYNLSLIETEKVITPKTKAIFLVHLYGKMASIDAFKILCENHKLLLFDDAAQAHGVENGQGERVGGLTDGTAFSFYPGKNLGAIGDGGAITTNNKEVADIIRAYRNYGSHVKYQNKYKGVNSRLDELQAAFLRLKLPHLDRDNNRRREIGRMYLLGISNPLIELPEYDDSKNHVFHLFVVRTTKRERLQQFLLENDVQTVIHYPIPPHKQECLPEYHNMNFPLTEKMHKRVLSLPISPVITNTEVNEVISIMNKFNG